MTEAEVASVTVDDVEGLALDGLRWLTGTARETDGGGLGWAVEESGAVVEPNF